VVLMARDALPMIFGDREQVEAGGLITDGASYACVRPTPLPQERLG
jgi:hypothetical protein